jgi:hypothetical protein
MRTVSIGAAEARTKIWTKLVETFVAISSDAGSIPAASTRYYYWISFMLMLRRKTWWIHVFPE